MSKIRKFFQLLLIKFGVFTATPNIIDSDSELAKSLINENLVEMLKEDEGIRAKVYVDTTGHKTVGIGFNMDSPAARRFWDAANVEEDFYKIYQGKETLSAESIEALLNIHLEDIEENIASIYPNIYAWSENRRNGLMNFYYQLGMGNVKKFVNTNKYINNEEWNLAAANLKKSKWIKQTPNRAKRVIELIQYG